MTKIRFHLDESVSNAISQGLRRRGIEVRKCKIILNLCEFPLIGYRVYF